MKKDKLDIDLTKDLTEPARNVVLIGPPPGVGHVVFERTVLRQIYAKPLPTGDDAELAEARFKQQLTDKMREYLDNREEWPFVAMLFPAFKREWDLDTDTASRLIGDWLRGKDDAEQPNR